MSPGSICIVHELEHDVISVIEIPIVSFEMEPATSTNYFTKLVSRMLGAQPQRTVEPSRLFSICHIMFMSVKGIQQ